MITQLKIFIDLFKPKFWDGRDATYRNQILFNYRKFWFFSIFLRLTVSIVPLVIFLIINLSLAHRVFENQNSQRIIRLTSNTRRTITFFFEERLNALRFILQEHTLGELTNKDMLVQLLGNLQMGFGGYTDLGLIDSEGLQINYAGPFDLEGKSYREESWFTKSIENGVYVSDVFLGYRKLPHMIITIKQSSRDGSFYILRATLEMKGITEILSTLELVEKSDAFLCNRDGILQTDSKYYGRVLEKTDIHIPEYSLHSQSYKSENRNGEPLLIGFAYIENSPYILLLIKHQNEIMKDWYFLRNVMILLFCVCSLIIIIVSLAISIFMLNKIHTADQTRLQILEHLESSNRLSSIGRLATGVAHEINNPLAVISENAGLIKDLFSLKKEYYGDQRLMELIETVMESVDRSGQITKQLLGFARHFAPKIEPLNLKEIIEEVLSFLRKEAQYRNISINVDIPDNCSVIRSDHGSLQQIFLNLINNAFQAVDDGGRLEISAEKKNNKTISISIKDDGCGISPEDQIKIFEPFFTTRELKGGTGLGLSITHGLVRKLNGTILLRSKLGEGATFIITLPIDIEGDI